jgi:GT2 family glycosyltransferase
MKNMINIHLFLQGEDLKIQEIIQMLNRFKKAQIFVTECTHNLKFIKKTIMKIFINRCRAKGEKYDLNSFMLIRNSALITKNALSFITVVVADKSQKILIYGDSIVKTSRKVKYWYEARPEWSPIFFNSHDFLGDLIFVTNQESYIVTDHNLDSIISLKLNDNTVKKVRVDFAITKRESMSTNIFEIPKLKAPSRVLANLNPTIVFEEVDEKFTIIIPTKFAKNEEDEYLIAICLKSIEEKALKFNFNVILNFNIKYEKEYKSLLEREKYSFRISKFVYTSNEFNFATIINRGVKESLDEFILILNDDVYFESKFDFECPLRHLMSDTIGTVGVRLLYPNQKIQHAGIYFENKTPQHWLYGSSIKYIPESHNFCREVSGSTGAFLFFRKSVFEKVGGMDEKFRLDYNDVELCLKMNYLGYKNILCADIVGYHFESGTRAKREVEKIEEEVNQIRQKYEIGSRDPFMYTPADRS